MLTDFQEKKINHLFRIYDQGRNGYLQLRDFLDLAGKICLKMEYLPGSRHHDGLITKTTRLWDKLMTYFEDSKIEVIYPKEWNLFFEENIVNSRTEEVLDEYVDMLIGFVFDLFDDNHDGYISIKEYKNMFEVFEIKDSSIEEVFYGLDLNKDKRLSKYEMVRAMEDFFTSNDPESKGNRLFGELD
ncbi:MAG: EF-hand domain-containing protein [Cyclobacteriaceae bacterium]